MPHVQMLYFRYRCITSKMQKVLIIYFIRYTMLVPCCPSFAIRTTLIYGIDSTRLILQKCSWWIHVTCTFMILDSQHFKFIGLWSGPKLVHIWLQITNYHVQQIWTIQGLVNDYRIFILRTVPIKNCSFKVPIKSKGKFVFT